MPDRHLVGLRDGLPAARQPAAGRVRRRALLRGLRAEPASGSWSAAARSLPNPALVKTFRGGRRDAGGHPVRPRRRPLLRRRLGRHDQADPLHGGQPGAARGRVGHPHGGQHAARRDRSARRARATRTATRSHTHGTWTATGPTTTRAASSPTFTYTSRGVYQVGLRVTDSLGATACDSVAITAGNTPPVATISTPTSGFTWDVGETIHFEGSATDAQEQRARQGPAQLDVPAPPLPLGLPHARGAVLPRKRLGRLRRAGPRVPVLPRAAAHGDRQRRPHATPRASGSTRAPSSSRCAPRRPGSS